MSQESSQEDSQNSYEPFVKKILPSVTSTVIASIIILIIGWAIGVITGVIDNINRIEHIEKAAIYFYKKNIKELKLEIINLNRLLEDEEAKDDKSKSLDTIKELDEKILEKEDNLHNYEAQLRIINK